MKQKKAINMIFRQSNAKANFKCVPWSFFCAARRAGRHWMRRTESLSADLVLKKQIRKKRRRKNWFFTAEERKEIKEILNLISLLNFIHSFRQKEKVGRAEAEFCYCFCCLFIEAMAGVFDIDIDDSVPGGPPGGGPVHPGLIGRRTEEEEEDEQVSRVKILKEDIRQLVILGSKSTGLVWSSLSHL